MGFISTFVRKFVEYRKENIFRKRNIIGIAYVTDYWTYFAGNRTCR